MYAFSRVPPTLAHHLYVSASGPEWAPEDPGLSSQECVLPGAAPPALHVHHRPAGHAAVWLQGGLL